MVDPPQVRIAVIDGVESSLAALKRLIADQPRWQVVYSATTATGSVDTLLRRRPDVVIVSESALGSGLSLVRRLCRFAASPAVLVRLGNVEPEATEEYLRAGAHGCVNEGVADAELLRAVRRALAHGFGLSPAVEDELIPHLLAASAPDLTLPEGWPSPSELLSPRERQIYLLLGKGRTIKEIARAINRSSQTVAFHLRKLRQKFGVRTNAQLARHATTQFLLDAPASPDSGPPGDVDPDAESPP